MTEMKYKILFKVDTELESDYDETNSLLASYITQHRTNDPSYLEILDLITNFYTELP